MIMTVPWTESRSGSPKSTPLTGHFPLTAKYFSISLLSNRCPVFNEITGSWGTSPETKINVKKRGKTVRDNWVKKW